MQRWLIKFLFGALLVSFPASAGARTVTATGDFNGDYKPDILWRHAVTGQLYTWLMSDGSLQAMSAFAPSGVADPRWKLAGIADFNRDSNPDLLWHHQTTGQLYVWFMGYDAVLDGTVQGDTGVPRTTQLGGKYMTPSSVQDPAWQVAATQDFDGNGLTDLLWHNQTTGELYVWYLGYDGGAADQKAVSGIGSSATTFFYGEYLTPRAVSDRAWKLVDSADFNRDGVPDLLWHNQTSGELYVWFLGRTEYGDRASANWSAPELRMAGGTYLSPSTVSDTHWQVSQLGDFNHDGYVDLLWQNGATGQLYVWYLGYPDRDITSISPPGGACTRVDAGFLTPSETTDPKWQVQPR